MVDISEKNFEETIEAVLIQTWSISPSTSHHIAREPESSDGKYIGGGYKKQLPQEYDKARCLVPQDVLDFILITQPKEWEKLKKSYSGDVKTHFLDRLSEEIRQHGTLHVLRKGIKDLGSTFKLVFFPPTTTLNKDILHLYQGNVFSVIRQLKYSEKNENSLDLGIFLNGIPLFTAELKDQLTGQNIQHAVTQYMHRDSKEPLFAYRRCLAHFAVDQELIFFTTHLQEQKTKFIPFNKGYNLGSGNPPTWKGYPTSYLWQQIWSRDSILNLLQYFIHEYDELNDKGEKTGKRILIFPRYHQLDSVRRIIDHALDNGSGQRYLIQHSAGSGKSNSIAWLAHQLSVLHDVKDQRIFNSVVIITDRRILDRQLQATVSSFEQTPGTVETIKENSQQLKRALEDEKQIIVTTLQKFPFISEQINLMTGNKFAVIIDEAHSSQSGQTTKHLSTTLSAGSLEAAVKVDTEEDEDDLSDKIIQ
jgi:type I restriction enzyme, R subunit